MNQTNSTSVKVTVEGILSYAYLDKPKVSTNKTTGESYSSYCTDVVFAPNSPFAAAVRDAQRAVAKAGWGEAMVNAAGPVDPATGQAAIIQLPNWQAVLNQLQAEKSLVLRDGNQRNKIEEPYQNNFFIVAKSKVRPRILVTRGGVQVEIPANDQHFPYSGCTARVIVELYAQGTIAKPSEYGKAIRCQLAGVQFLAHGNRFGGGRIANLDEFGLSPADADAPTPGGAPAGASAGPSLV